MVMPKVFGSDDFANKASGKHIVVTSSHKTMATVVLRKGKSRIDGLGDDINGLFMVDVVLFQKMTGCVVVMGRGATRKVRF
jgi:hypothetical protein